jgi:hypothetical protein
MTHGLKITYLVRLQNNLKQGPVNAFCKGSDNKYLFVGYEVKIKNII